MYIRICYQVQCSYNTIVPKIYQYGLIVLGRVPLCTNKRKNDTSYHIIPYIPRSE